MPEKYSPQHPGQVRKQSERQYEYIYNGYADARRALYPYELAPGEEREPYNIWEDMATHFDPENLRKIIEFGANDGYFHSILRHAGFKGEYIGIDIEGRDLPAAEFIARHRFPNVEVKFMQGDAQNLRDIIPSSSTPAAAANFITYHSGRPDLVISELHRILEPGGLGEISSRSVTNQADTWAVAQWVAHSHGFAFPQELSFDGKRTGFIPGVPLSRISVYSHFDIEKTRDFLQKSKKFEILYEKIQDKDLWIPTDKESGIYDLCNAVESLLPYTINMSSRQNPSVDDLAMMHTFIHEHMQHYFVVSGMKNKNELDLPSPFYISHATQGFFVVRAIK